MSIVSAIAVERPGEGEFAPFYASYIAAVPGISDAVGQLGAQSDQLAAMIAPLSDAQAGYRYAEGKWSIKEVVGHLADAERIFSYRLLRIGRGDATPLPGFDENAYVPAGEFDRRTVSDILEEWIAVRSATACLVGGLPPEAWKRRGMANGKDVSARAILYVMLGHVDHHRRMLEERYGLSR
jgi:hypothetical protein